MVGLLKLPLTSLFPVVDANCVFNDAKLFLLGGTRKQL